MKKIFLLLTSFIIFTGCIVQHEKESDVIISVVPTNEVVSINEETNALDSNIQFTMTQITENINPIELEEIEVDYCDSVLGDYKIKELDTYLLNQGSSASIVISSVINSTVIYRLSEELIIPVNFTFKFKTSSDLEKKVHTSVLLNYIEEEKEEEIPEEFDSEIKLNWSKTQDNVLISAAEIIKDEFAYTFELASKNQSTVYLEKIQIFYELSNENIEIESMVIDTVSLELYKEEDSATYSFIDILNEAALNYLIDTRKIKLLMEFTFKTQDGLQKDILSEEMVTLDSE